MEACGKEHFTAEELRLLQGVLNTDRKTIDYVEGVVSGLDMTERRASAGMLILKVRRLLDRELSDEMDRRKRELEAAQAAEKARMSAPPEEPEKKGPLGIVGGPEDAARELPVDPPAEELAGELPPAAPEVPASPEVQS